VDGVRWGWLAPGVAVLALVTAVLAVRLLVKLVRARRLLRAAGVPLSTKAMFWGSIAYTVWPVDLLPDPVYLDDLGFLLLALRSVHAALARARAADGDAGADGTR
jgi:uncharacterized membrane protein YkvA (DUF1232 family)